MRVAVAYCTKAAVIQTVFAWVSGRTRFSIKARRIKGKADCHRLTVLLLRHLRPTSALISNCQPDRLVSGNEIEALCRPFQSPHDGHLDTMRLPSAYIKAKRLGGQFAGGAWQVHGTPVFRTETLESRGIDRCSGMEFVCRSAMRSAAPAMLKPCSASLNPDTPVSYWARAKTDAHGASRPARWRRRRAGP